MNVKQAPDNLQGWVCGEAVGHMQKHRMMKRLHAPYFVISNLPAPCIDMYNIDRHRSASYVCQHNSLVALNKTTSLSCCPSAVKN